MKEYAAIALIITTLTACNADEKSTTFLSSNNSTSNDSRMAAGTWAISENNAPTESTEEISIITIIPRTEDTVVITPSQETTENLSSPDSTVDISDTNINSDASVSSDTTNNPVIPDIVDNFDLPHNSDIADSSENPETVENQQAFEAIAGVYSFPDFGVGTKEYIVVSADGSYSEYSYSQRLNDSAKKNCYQVSKTNWQIEKNNFDSYRINKGSNTFNEKLLFSNDEIKFFFIFDGTLTDYHFTFRKENHLNESALTPHCGQV